MMHMGDIMSTMWDALYNRDYPHCAVSISHCPMQTLHKGSSFEQKEVYKVSKKSTPV